MKKLLISLLAVFALTALAAGQSSSSKTSTAGTKKASPSPSKSKPMEMKERMKYKDKKSLMSEEAGCIIANKGRKGQICLYDIDTIPMMAKKKDHPPVYVSPDNEESILWYSSAKKKFRISELVRHTKDTENCPVNPFLQDVAGALAGDKDKDKDKDDMLQGALFSGMARKEALGCEYKPVLKVKVKGKIETWDPHIIIGP